MTTRNSPVVRVSILRCKAERFQEFERMMTESARILLPGIRAMHGCRGYFAGSDQATSSLSNVSVWETLEDAKQMERFQPMLDLGKQFLDAGATFERLPDYLQRATFRGKLIAINLIARLARPIAQKLWSARIGARKPASA